MEAPSTLACTAYNLLATAGAPRTVRELTGPMAQCHPQASPAQLVAALKALVQLGRAMELPGDRYTLLDQQHRKVRWRDRDRMPPQDAPVQGMGWYGWMVQDPILGMLPVEQAVQN